MLLHAQHSRQSAAYPLAEPTGPVLVGAQHSIRGGMMISDTLDAGGWGELLVGLETKGRLEGCSLIIQRGGRMQS